jgi:hypothetical protein
LNGQTNRSEFPTKSILIKTDSRNRHLQTDGQTGVAILIGGFLLHLFVKTAEIHLKKFIANVFVWFTAMLLPTSC